MEKKTIGKFIAALRRANGMTQRELGERLFVSDKTVSKWENGTTVEWGNLNWWFDDFKAAGGKFDMIGLSHYPENAIDTKWATMNDWEKVNTAAIKHIQLLASTYNCKVMVCEVGVKTQANETTAAQVLAAFMSEAKKIEACAGVFYWEPECKPSQYKLGAFTEDGRPTRIMDAFKE